MIFVWNDFNVNIGTRINGVLIGMSKEEIFELTYEYMRLMVVKAFYEMLKSLDESGGIIIIPQATSAEHTKLSAGREAD